MAGGLRTYLKLVYVARHSRMMSKYPTPAFKGNPLASVWAQESFHSIPSTKKQGQKETNYIFTSDVLKERQDGSRDGRRDLSVVHAASLFHVFMLKSIKNRILVGLLDSWHHMKNWKSGISSWELCNQRAGFDWCRHGRKLLQEAHFRSCAAGREETELWT